MKDMYIQEFIQVRQLIGALQARLLEMQKGIDVLLQDVQNKDEVQLTIEIIADTLGVTPEDIKGKSRVRAISDARTITGVVLYTKFNVSTKTAGKMIGVDHSTLIHYLVKVTDLVKSDVAFSLNLRKVMQRLELSHLTIKRNPDINIPIQSLIKSL